MKIVKSAFGICACFAMFSQVYSMDAIQEDMRTTQEAFSKISVELEKSEVVSSDVIQQLYMDAAQRISNTILNLVKYIASNSSKQSEESYSKSDGEHQMLGLSCYGFFDSFWELSPEGRVGKSFASKVDKLSASKCFEEYRKLQEKLPVIE